MKKTLLITTAAAFVFVPAIYILISEGGLKPLIRSDYARLEAKPNSLKIKVGEGERIESKFELKNTGSGKALVNFYKTEEATEKTEPDADIIEKLISRKKQGDLATAEDLKKSADFSGASWILIFPYYAVVEQDGMIEVKLTIDAKDLAVGVHHCNLIALGVQKEELKVIPIEVTVLESSRLKVSKVEIDDGFSEDTTGNQNHVAGSGEKVALVASLTNEGGMTAKNITARLSFDDASVRNFGDGIAKIPSVDSGQTEKVRIVFEVGKEFSSEIPPSGVLEISDGSGKKWSDNFYLGEEGAFEYPAGLNEQENNSFEPPNLNP
jgi:hypothetical protein